LTKTAPVGRASQFLSRWLYALAPLSVLILLAIVIGSREPRFFSGGNLSNVVIRNVSLALIAVGETVVIIAGQIDLSVGSVMALSAVSAALTLKATNVLALALLVGVLVGVLCGLVNGLVTTKAKLPAFIATLAMMGLARGLALVLAKARTVEAPSHLSSLIGRPVLGVQVAIWLLVVAALVAWLVLSRMVFGRNTYALGSNPVAARLSGIRVDRSVILIFALNGLLVGMAGMVEFMQNTCASPTMGQLKELDAIAAVVIGGASLSGGQGSVAGSLLGVAIMAVLQNGCNLLKLPNEWQKVVIGPLIVLAVLCDRWLKQRQAARGR